jgi:hypothetical protein
MISSSQNAVRPFRYSKPNRWLSAALRRDEFFFATRSPEVPIDKHLCQNRRDLQAAADEGRRFSRWEEAYSLSSAVPMVEVRRACSRKQLSLRRSDALSHIQFFKGRKLQPK